MAILQELRLAQFAYALLYAGGEVRKDGDMQLIATEEREKGWDFVDASADRQDPATIE